MGELSFLTIIVSLAVCSILVFAVYQYMKVRFTVLEHSQKEQALILQQYIEESSYDIQGLQSVVFRQRGGAGVQQQEHQAQMDASEPEEVYEDHNKHIHMDTVMYEAPNKPRSTLIAISSDSENTTSDEDDDGESDGSSSSDSDGSSSDGEESGSSSDGSDSDGSDDSEIESENVHMIHDIHEVKHIEISSTLDDHDNELEIESVTIIDEEPSPAPAPVHEEPALETKTITLDLGTSVDTDEHQLAESSTASSESSAAASASSSVSFHGLSVIELRALLKEKYKGQHDKITNLQKLKKPELIQLLHE
jgi:hypothetical protein